jgi:hypothetical protein
MTRPVAQGNAMRRMTRVELVLGERGWSLVDGTREHVVEGDNPLACKRCRLPLFLDDELDLNFCGFCNEWKDGPPAVRCPPSEQCIYCDARRSRGRPRPLSRALADDDALVADFLRQVIPRGLLDS